MLWKEQRICQYIGIFSKLSLGKSSPVSSGDDPRVSLEKMLIADVLLLLTSRSGLSAIFIFGILIK